MYRSSSSLLLLPITVSPPPLRDLCSRHFRDVSSTWRLFGTPWIHRCRRLHHLSLPERDADVHVYSTRRWGSAADAACTRAPVLNAGVPLTSAVVLAVARQRARRSTGRLPITSPLPPVPCFRAGVMPLSLAGRRPSLGRTSSPPVCIQSGEVDVTSEIHVTALRLSSNGCHVGDRVKPATSCLANLRVDAINTAVRAASDFTHETSGPLPYYVAVAELYYVATTATTHVTNCNRLLVMLFWYQ